MKTSSNWNVSTRLLLKITNVYYSSDNHEDACSTTSDPASIEADEQRRQANNSVFVTSTKRSSGKIILELIVDFLYCIGILSNIAQTGALQHARERNYSVDMSSVR